MPFQKFSKEGAGKTEENSFLYFVLENKGNCLLSMSLRPFFRKNGLSTSKFVHNKHQNVDKSPRTDLKKHKIPRKIKNIFNKLQKIEICKVL